MATLHRVFEEPEGILAERPIRRALSVGSRFQRVAVIFLIEAWPDGV